MSIASPQQNSQHFPPALIAAAVLWCAIVGAGSVATKIANGGMSPVFQAGLRSLIATFLVLAYVRLRGKRFEFFDQSLWPGLCAGVLFALEFWALFEGLNRTTVARATLFLYTAPFFVAPIAHFFLPHDRLSRAKLIGLVIAFIGVALVFSDRLVPAAGSAGPASTLLGDLLCITAAFFWGMTTIIIKATRLRSEAPEKNLIYQLAVSGVLLLAVSWLIGERGIFAPSLSVWLAFSYQTVIVASAGYLAWFMLIARYSASTMHAFTFLSPIFGVMAGTLMMKEPLSWKLLCALALVAAGLWLVNRNPAPRE